ncbi:methionine ABC transporter ATP-binding protein [Herbiconiux flava]|uniref:D-methionine transport system ATP-binding protein n=1 Tax=Herbiconiux flava TaxID=881268 RepID=A0A852SMS4_9MICO|nr:methionine ABC transporter ATP-binding protein [Herbiconiux flava]NYD70106.1 D-methionine transport system ATP-binding protein [Herbiconiux flava]GLK16858.1 methionine import ATP-binding protein MetN [Herbiconiux flava]
MPLVSLRDVRKTFPAATRGAPPVTAVDGVDLAIEAGEVFGIVGYSGAGKSTLVRLVNGLETVTSGSITVGGVELNGLPERELRRLRVGIGMIFQQFNLFTAKTVRGNISYPLRVAGTPRAEIARRVDELLGFVGLADKADSHPEQLSGGQKQRVGIARALATSPRLLLADEATSALDPETTHEVLGLLKRVNQELGVTMIVITHEMDVVQTLADKVAVMEGGRVVEQGDVFDVFSDPQQASSRRFVSTVVRGVPTEEELAVLRVRHPGALVTLSFSDGGSSGTSAAAAAPTQAEVFAALSRAGLGFELVYGGVNDIRGRVFGHLTLALTGPDAVVEQALASLPDGVGITRLANGGPRG